MFKQLGKAGNGDWLGANIFYSFLLLTKLTNKSLRVEKSKQKKTSSK